MPGHEMSNKGEVLIAIINDQRDFAILQNQGWYRVPVSSVRKWLKNRWPPEWIGFYLTKIFGEDALSVRYYGEVIEIRKEYRGVLFPNEELNEKSNRQYYQIFLSPLKQLPEPIISRKWRRITFIPTTWGKFVRAMEINDLYDESPLEDRLWIELKKHEIPAERQEFITVMNQFYALDFAIYCQKYDINVETDGDSWHANPEKSEIDNLRDNRLVAAGWQVLRFTTRQIMEQTEDYCIKKVAETINKQGGLDEDKYMPRKINLKTDGSYQLGLFDDIGNE